MRALTELFEIIKKYKLKPNSAKCPFGVNSGKFLGYLVTQWGIMVNPEQIVTIKDLDSPRTAKKVQKLTGMATMLNRFISKFFDKCRLFFDLLHKNTNFSRETSASSFSNSSRSI